MTACEYWGWRCVDGGWVRSGGLGEKGGLPNNKTLHHSNRPPPTRKQTSRSLRLWDRRKALRPVLVHERDVGGGVWRIKWRQPDDAAAVAAGGAGGLLALACMHGGAAVWRLDGDGDGVGALEEVASYRGHQSMAYGIDWCECRGLAAGGQEDESTRRQLLLASCSFYDHALHLWAAGGEGR